MADDIVIRITGDAEAAKAALKGVQDHLTQLGGKTEEAGKKTESMTSSVLKAQIAFEVLRKGIQLVTNFLKDSIQAFIEQERVEAQLNATLKSTGYAAGLTAEQLKKMASGFQDVTTFGDEAVLGAQALMLTFTKIGKDIFPQATEIILDMSTALGQDLKSSAIQLGKALQDPILGVTALRRVGVNFNEAQTDLIKNLVNTGRAAEAQALIMKELQVEFGGSARAARETLGGSLKALQNQFGDMQEEIGKALVPVLLDLVKAIMPIIEGIKNLDKSTIQIALAFAGVVIAIVAVIKIMQSMQMVFAAGLGPLGVMLIAMTALAAVVIGVNQAIAAGREAHQKLAEQYETERTEVQELRAEYEKLTAKTILNENEKKRLIEIEGILKERVGETSIAFDEQTGKMQLNLAVIDRYNVEQLAKIKDQRTAQLAADEQHLEFQKKKTIAAELYWTRTAEDEEKMRKKYTAAQVAEVSGAAAILQYGFNIFNKEEAIAGVKREQLEAEEKIRKTKKEIYETTKQLSQEESDILTIRYAQLYGGEKALKQVYDAIETRKKAAIPVPGARPGTRPEDEEEKKKLEKRLENQKDWQRKLFDLKATEKAKLEADMAEALANVENNEAAKLAIKEYYAKKINALAEKSADEQETKEKEAADAIAAAWENLFLNQLPNAIQSGLSSISEIIAINAQNAINALQEQLDIQLEMLDEQTEERLRIYDQDREAGKRKLEKEIEDLQAAINKTRSAARKAGLQKELDAKLAELNILKIKEEAAAEEKRLREESAREAARINYRAAEAQWAIMLTQAIANTAVGVINALASTFWPLNLVAAALVGAAGALQISVVAMNKPKPPAFEFGGISAGGLAMVGEAGPEVVNLPAGARVYNNTESQEMMSRSTIINFHSPRAIDAGQANTMLRRTLRNLSYKGVV